MNIRHLAIVPALFLMAACGGSSTPEPETPAGEAAGAAEEAKPADAPAAEEAPKADEAAPAAAEEAKPAEEAK